MKKVCLILMIFSTALLMSCMISCANEVTVTVDEEVPRGVEYKLELPQDNKVLNGSEVAVKVWLEEGYGGSFTVSVNGKSLIESEDEADTYKFTVSGESVIVIQGDTYREVDAIEFAHDILFVDQDFDTTNPYITVKYKNGETERIFDYTYRGYEGLAVGEEAVTVGFASDGRNVTVQDVPVTVTDNDGYLLYVRTRLSEASSKFDRIFVKGGSASIYVTDGKLYYSNMDTQIWIDGGEYHMIYRPRTASGDTERCLTHKFNSMNEAITALKDYIKDIPFDIKESVELTLRGILNQTSGVSELSMTRNEVTIGIEQDSRSYVYNVDIFDWFVSSLTVTDRSVIDDESEFNVYIYNDLEPEDMTMPNRQWVDSALQGDL